MPVGDGEWAGEATDTTARTAPVEPDDPPVAPVDALDAAPVGLGAVGVVVWGAARVGGDVEFGTSLLPRPEDSAEIRG